MTPPSNRAHVVMLIDFWIELVLLAGGLVLMLTVNVWPGLALVILGLLYAIVVIPRRRERLGFNRWRGGWTE